MIEHGFILTKLPITDTHLLICLKYRPSVLKSLFNQFIILIVFTAVKDILSYVMCYGRIP